MTDYRRAYLKGGTFFFTGVTYKRYPVFKRKSSVDLLWRSIKSVVDEHPFEMRAYVLLPDHIHCIWTLPKEDSDYSTRWKKIKSRFTRRYSSSNIGPISESMRKKGERGVWQRRFWEHVIWDQEDFNKHCDYIHFNPVKHGLVDSPAKWKYSSFSEFVEKGMYSPNWGQEALSSLIEMDLE